MRAGAAEAGLHFIRDANSARRAHVFVSVLEITVRENDAAADALDGFGDEAGDLPGSGVVDHVFHVVRIFLAGLGIVAAPNARDTDRARSRDERRSCAAH